MNKRINIAYQEKKNNATQVVMEEAIKKFGGTRDDSRKSIIHVGKGSFCVSVSPDFRPEARQMYESVDGLITYSIENGHWFMIEKQYLNISERPTRIAPDGEKSFNAHGIFLKGFQI